MNGPERVSVVICSYDEVRWKALVRAVTSVRYEEPGPDEVEPHSATASGSVVECDRQRPSIRNPDLRAWAAFGVIDFDGDRAGGPQKVAAITPDDVQRVAQKYIDLGHLQVVAVGDAAKAREVLAKYGKVELFDADGKPLSADNSNK